MNWHPIAAVLIVLFMLYTAYEAAVSFALIPRKYPDGKKKGPTYSPGESLWAVASVWGIGIFFLLSLG